MQICLPRNTVAGYVIDLRAVASSRATLCYLQFSIGMGLEPHSSFAALHQSVSQHIQELASQHKLRVIIALDEAQLLAVQVLEQLHILLNFEKDSKPWLSLILIGLPDLLRHLVPTAVNSEFQWFRAAGDGSN
jgi:type II secretory pathway predicted ATPase ExeA